MGFPQTAQTSISASVEDDIVDELQIGLLPLLAFVMSFDLPTRPVFSHKVVTLGGVVVGVEGDTVLGECHFHDSHSLFVQFSHLKSFSCL